MRNIIQRGVAVTTKGFKKRNLTAIIFLNITIVRQEALILLRSDVMYFSSFAWGLVEDPEKQGGRSSRVD